MRGGEDWGMGWGLAGHRGLVEGCYLGIAIATIPPEPGYG